MKCPYCGSVRLCPHSYVDNSEAGSLDNPANIQFSKIPVRNMGAQPANALTEDKGEK